MVVVVLDNRKAVCARELHEPQPSPGRHGHRGGILVMRCHVDSPNPLLDNDTLQSVYVHSIVIDGYANNLRADQPECLPRRSISQLFDHDDVIGTKKRLRQQRECHLTAACNTDMLWASRQTTS